MLDGNGFLSQRNKRILWRRFGRPANRGLQQLWSGYQFVRLHVRSYIVKETCPYCFERFSLRESKFRCHSPQSSCAWARDPVLEKVWEVKTPQGKVVSGPGAFARSAVCPDCKKTTNRRICPHCHLELPSTIGENKNLSIAIIGSKDSGKTNYIAVLVDVIKRLSGDSLGMVLYELDDYTISRYQSTFYDPLFVKKKALDATTSRRVADVDGKRPLVFCLQASRRDGLLAGIVRRSVTLVFYDTAGEDLNSEDTAAVHNKYIYCADGIILLVDPLQCAGVRATMPGHIPLPDQNTEPGEILTRVTNLIGKGLKRRVGAPVAAPLAVTLTKIDAVKAQVDRGNALHHTARHAGGFDHQDFEQLNSDVRRQLTAWNYGALVTQAEGRFETVGYFAVSALGESPDASKKLTKILPHRVEDPFLWLLYENNFLESR